MPFVKGQSGNPGGKPTDRSLTDLIRMKLFADERKKLNQMADVQIARALSGDSVAFKEIYDRLEGKPLQTTENHNVNENHYVRAPEKASKDDWGKYLDSKAKPAPAAAKPVNGANGNGKSH